MSSGTTAVRSRSRRAPESVGAAAVVLAFVVSRVAYARAGVRFDASPIGYFAQLLDPILLRERLGESLFHLHAQPPLYNLLTGLALKVSPDAPGHVLGPLFAACGLYAGLCLYVVLRRLDVPVVVGAAIAGAVVSAPPFVLYENLYFYPHLNVAWLLGAVAWLATSRGRPGVAASLGAMHLVLLVYTRSLFHPVFFVTALLAALAFVAPSARLRVAGCFALPALLVLALAAKNAALFGFFGTSSWASRNVARAVQTSVGQDRVRAEAALGRLSRGALRSAFEPGDVTARIFGVHVAPTGVPALDDVRKRQPGINPINYNHASYPITARYYAEDAKHLLRTYPAAYARGVATRAIPTFLRPVDQDDLFLPNRRMIPDATRAFEVWESSAWARGLVVVGLLLALALLADPRTPRAHRLVLAVAFVAIAWVTVVGVLGEIGENYRFRYKILWLAWAVAAAGYCWAARTLARRFA